MSEEDPGYCGIGIETGEQDPFWIGKVCPDHDAAFNQLKAKMRTDNGLAVTRQFMIDSTGVFLRSLYGVAAFPFYLVFGGIGGLLRWSQLKRQLGMQPHLIDKDHLDIDG